MTQSRQPHGPDDDPWTRRVTPAGHDLTRAPAVFTWRDPRLIAQSLKASAEANSRSRTTPFRTAMSMLTFHINRAGARLPDEQRAILEAAKAELRALFEYRTKRAAGRSGGPRTAPLDAP